MKKKIVNKLQEFEEYLNKKSIKGLDSTAIINKAKEIIKELEERYKHWEIKNGCLFINGENKGRLGDGIFNREPIKK